MSVATALLLTSLLCFWRVYALMKTPIDGFNYSGNPHIDPVFALVQVGFFFGVGVALLVSSVILFSV